MKGAPSDHFVPGRSFTVVTRPSGEMSRLWARFGMMALASVLKRNSVERAYRSRLQTDLDENAARMSPPYLPISSNTGMTRGSVGRRSSTGGSLPASTSWASSGASLNSSGAGAVTAATNSFWSSTPSRAFLASTAAAEAAAPAAMAASPAAFAATPAASAAAVAFLASSTASLTDSLMIFWTSAVVSCPAAEASTIFCTSPAVSCPPVESWTIL